MYLHCHERADIDAHEGEKKRGIDKRVREAYELACRRHQQDVDISIMVATDSDQA